MNDFSLYLHYITGFPSQRFRLLLKPRASRKLTYTCGLESFPKTGFTYLFKKLCLQSSTSENSWAAFIKGSYFLIFILKATLLRVMFLVASAHFIFYIIRIHCKRSSAPLTCCLPPHQTSYATFELVTEQSPSWTSALLQSQTIFARLASVILLS